MEKLLIQIVDENGNILRNHYRLGNLIIVDDEKTKAEYNNNLNNMLKIKKLENELEELKAIINKLLEK